MLGVLTGFVEELRASGLPVSLTETLDAAAACEQVPLGDRRAFRSALAATLVKSSEHLDAFTVAFEVYFSPRRAGTSGGASVGAPGTSAGEATDDASGAAPDGATRGDLGDRDAGAVDRAGLQALLDQALRNGEPAALATVARWAVVLHAGVEPGRPVGVAYYLYKTLRGLDLDGRLAALMHEVSGKGDASLAPEPLRMRLLADELTRRAEHLRGLVESELRASLVGERGVAAVQRSLRRPLVEDVDVMHASAEELVLLRKALYPLARVLAARLSRRRRHRHRGSLDVRSTIRRSLSTGGVPLEPRFHTTRPAKPEIFVVADVSGSVASFARFTLYLVHAMSSQFSKVRSFVFVDGIDEVTDIFARSSSVTEAVARVDAEAGVVHRDGHSDYGHALGVFAERWGRAITTRTTVIVIGDARSNYHPANADALAEIARRARHVYWLNPEPRAYWGSGDSIVEQYGQHVDGVFECRNLRQLERVVDLLA